MALPVLDYSANWGLRFEWGVICGIPYLGPLPLHLNLHPTHEIATEGQGGLLLYVGAKGR